MDKLAANIAEYGVLHPGIIREAGNGRYQMISGHRRLYASRKAGKVTMPVRIMNLSDDSYGRCQFFTKSGNYAF